MTRILTLACVVFGLCFTAHAQVALNINGVTDKTVYTDKASFYVPTNAGYTYLVLLDDAPVAAYFTNVVTRMDYHEVNVWRTNTSTSDVTNRLVRFIVQSSNRGDPERGLIEWTPYPSIPSTAAEFAGAQLRLIVPTNYPTGLEIPVVAWAEDAQGNERRANGFVTAPGFESSPVKVLRGVGSGFLPPQTSGGVLSYGAQLHSMSAPKQITIEPATTWTTVSGVITGAVQWPANSRIHVTGHLFVTNDATLTVGPGTVVRLNPLMNLTNAGRIVINGTADQPVVFTATNHIVPDGSSTAWGGFVMRTNTSELVANYAIFNGGAGAPSWSFSPGSSHKSHQAVLFLQFGARAAMTNCAVINCRGQIGNGYQAQFTLDHVIFERAITSGEYDTCTNIYHHCALIEFPEENGVVNATIADYDYDAIYFIRGTNLFTNTLVGFAKDDAIDSGSDNTSATLGTIRVEHCWIESALHECMAWSGHNRKTYAFDTVAMNSGQGIENGWTDGSSSYSPGAGMPATTPDCYAERLLSTANSVGARVGDNYTWAYRGFLRLTNSLVLYNYRDAFLKTWNGVGVSLDTNSWVDRLTQIAFDNCKLTKADPRFPATPAWQPATDAPMLAQWMTTPPNAPVGLGIAVWSNQFEILNLSNGVPVRLSSFTTNPVVVRYTFESAAGVLESASLTFAPGETLKRAVPTLFNPANQEFVRFSIHSPQNGEITGRTNAFYVKAEAPAALPPATTLIATNGQWKYLDTGVDQGTAWRAAAFDDSTWKSGAAQLGFGDGDEITVILKTNASGAQLPTYYFRRAFVASNVTAFANLTLWLLRDDGGVVYLNGNEVFRSSSMPPAPFVITYSVLATNYNGGAAPPDNTVDIATISTAGLVNGTNVIAVEIHQQALNSSDLSFDFGLTGNYPTPLPPQHLRLGGFGGGLTLGWSDDAYILEQANAVTGAWNAVTSPSPVSVTTTNAQQYFRLRR